MRMEYYNKIVKTLSNPNTSSTCNWFTAQKMKFSVKNFFGKREQMFNGKLHFCAVVASKNFPKRQKDTLHFYDNKFDVCIKEKS